MSAIDAFLLFVIGGMLIHFRPDQAGGTWSFIFLIGGIVGCGICIYRLGVVAFPALFHKSG